MEEKKISKPSAEKTPSWLKTIQLNSWEAELLISALVLYTLFQIPDFLEVWALQSFERGSELHRFFRVIEKAIRLLSFGYILHILVRGIWVASVGLSYVFPKGIDVSSLKFKGKFNKELTNSGSLVKMVLRLEELSSIIYGISFIFFGTLAGFASFIFSFIFFFELIAPVMSDNTYLAGVIGILILFYFLLTILVFIDFLTNGYFRRKNWSADWFYYVAFFFRIVTLSFLYRRSLLVLISNTKGWKSYLIPFVVLSVVVGFLWVDSIIKDNERDRYYISSAAGDYNSANYENIRNSDSFLACTIQSDIINDNTLKIFMKDIGVFGGIHVFEKKLKGKKWDELSSDSISIYFNNRLSVKIDDTPINDIDWFKTQHPVTYEFGFTSFVEINDFEKGAHFLKIGIDTTGMQNTAKKIVDKGNYSLQTISNIYFIYDKP
ncbi:hypothetical protein [Ekhidna sp.]|uniref:hypothetical protein n=1 Tax=Ekhidna sp. TaxID=2608089 RepID=UPI0032EEE731